MSWLVEGLLGELCEAIGRRVKRALGWKPSQSGLSEVLVGLLTLLIALPILVGLTRAIAAGP